MAEKKFKRKLCIDFDGVIHSYITKWQGANVISDPPVPGAIEWLNNLPDTYEINIYSSRSRQEGGIQAMQTWLLDHGVKWDVYESMKFPTEKPAAYLTIDDRAICFQGTFPSVIEMDNFKPWNSELKTKED